MNLPLDKRRLRFLAHMGARGCLGQAVYDLAKREDLSFSVVSADLGIASGFQRFIDEYPDRYINVGIAEQNLIGLAAGMAQDDDPVIATSWGAFASYRCADQIRNYLGYMQNNVKIVGMDSGLTLSRFGGSHFSIGDIALIRSIPGITLLSPCDGIEIYQCIEAALKLRGPVYIRLTGGETLPVINQNSAYRFVIGKAQILQQGSDISIVTTGSMTEQCLAAVKILEAHGVSCSLINISTIKPLDRDALLSQINHKLIVTVEEHNVLGGLGSVVAEVLTDVAVRPRQIMLGIPDMIPPAGTYKYLLSYCGLLGEQIAERVLEAWKETV